MTLMWLTPWPWDTWPRDLELTDLSVRLVARLVCLAQMEANDLGVFLVEMLHQVQSALAQRLANRVEEDKDQVGHVTYNQRTHKTLKVILKDNNIFWGKRYFSTNQFYRNVQRPRGRGMSTIHLRVGAGRK